MLPAAITIPGGGDGLWTLLFVPLSIALAAAGGGIGILLTRRPRAEPAPSAEQLSDPVPPEPEAGR
ncbi:hypothetical protein [Pseudolysinimonas sp.]|uniref:hypothetical protein n=1 Tax=Pseudolysinimonas sp. TaxID=2680009 RepID=UPI003F7D672B